MELDGDSQPMWSQPTTTLLRQRCRQPPSPPIINPVVLILLLPILALLILFFLVPPLLTHTTQILRPNSVKKGWDSFNILLVVFAILCGIFARKNDENSSHVERNRNVSTSDSSNFNDGSASAHHDMRHPASGDRWFEPSHEKAYNFGVTETGLNRLRRSSNSYPDLRQVPQWEIGENQSRFYDDSMASEYDSHRQRRSEKQRGEFDIKVIPVDTVKIRSSPPEPPSSEKPRITSSKPPQANLKRRRSFHSVPRKDKAEKQSNEAEVEHNEKQEPPPPSPPMPPSLPTELSPPVDKLQRRKSGTKELATAIASLYNQSKRKRRTKKRDKFESVSDSPPCAEEVLPPTTPPPPRPPPPPPPPSKVFQNLFKKNRKSKRVHSDPSNVPSPPPPPPPPPPNSIFNNLFKTGSKSKRFQQTASSSPPPPPPPPPPSSVLNNLFKHGTKSRRFKSPISTPTPTPPPPPPPQAHVSSRRRNSSTHSQPSMQPPEHSLRHSASWSKPPLPTKPTPSYYDDKLNSGSQSPLIPMPPPMPPFKMREMNFVPSGDFVRIRTAHSSRCSSPDLEDVDVDVDVDVDDVPVKLPMDGEDLTGSSVSCPSPDVNMKADTFIARLRDEWRLEKMNSLREKSTLG